MLSKVHQLLVIILLYSVINLFSPSSRLTSVLLLEDTPVTYEARARAIFLCPLFLASGMPNLPLNFCLDVGHFADLI